MKTRTKIRLARIASSSLRLARRMMGQGQEALATRRGIKWRLDLAEGIDLSIYLLGAFERRTVLAYEKILSPGDVAIDVGANVGAHTLPMAKCVGAMGRVFAFEPTGYAFAKLLANLSLNAPLRSVVTAEQAMLVRDAGVAVETQLHSSWPLVREEGLHSQHLGRLMATEGAVAVTLDDYLDDRRIEDVKLIKIDVDGNECNVLGGGKETLRRWQPRIIIELMPQENEEGERGFEEMLAVLKDSGYRLRRLASGTPLPIDPKRLKALIPRGSGINALASAR